MGCPGILLFTSLFKSGKELPTPQFSFIIVRFRFNNTQPLAYPGNGRGCFFADEWVVGFYGLLDFKVVPGLFFCCASPPKIGGNKTGVNNRTIWFFKKEGGSQKETGCRKAAG